MSSDKAKRQERRLHTHEAVERQLRIYHFYNPGKAPTEVVGKWRKRKAFNCGRARCKLCCNPRRLWGHTTFPEKRAEVAFAQDLAALD